MVPGWVATAAAIVRRRAVLVDDQVVSALVLLDRQRARRVAGSHRNVAKRQRVISTFLHNQAVCAVGVFLVGSGERRFTGVGGDAEIGVAGDVGESGTNGRVISVQEELLGRFGIESNLNACCQEACVHSAVTGQRDMHGIIDVDRIRLAAKCRIDQVQRAIAREAVIWREQNVALIVFDG